MLWLSNWCQLLTHISRANEGDVMIVDEPETYLHPKVQKQLLDIVRDTGAQVFMASLLLQLWHQPAKEKCWEWS